MRTTACLFSLLTIFALGCGDDDGGGAQIVIPVAKWLRIPVMLIVELLQMVEIPRVEPVWAAT